MRIDELLALLNRKVSEPASEGIAGQHLITDGAGGRSWSGAGQTVAAEKVRINGADYYVRTGSSGAAGYLTIGANALWLDTEQVTLKLGTADIVKMYGGTSEIYNKNAARAVLFDNGWVEGVEWSGNLLTRPNYTSQGRYSFDNVESNGIMSIWVNVSSNYSAVNHNSHICTTNPVSIPSNATSLKVTLNRTGMYNNHALLYRFGLLSEPYTNSCDPAQGGQMTEYTDIGTTATTTLTIPLNAGIAGTSIYRVVLNCRRTVKDEGGLTFNITKVWFE